MFRGVVRGRLMFTCNPDLDGDDFEKLVELGLARMEQIGARRDLKYYLKIDVYKDTGQIIPKDDYETLGINKQLTKAVPF